MPEPKEPQPLKRPQKVKPPQEVIDAKPLKKPELPKV